MNQSAPIGGTGVVSMDLTGCGRSPSLSAGLSDPAGGFHHVGAAVCAGLSRSCGVPPCAKWAARAGGFFLRVMAGFLRFLGGFLGCGCLGIGRNSAAHF